MLYSFQKISNSKDLNTGFFCFHLGKTRIRFDHVYQLLEVPYVQRKALAECSLRLRGPRLYNKLPEEVKKSENFATFERKLKTFTFRCDLRHSDDFT